MAKSIDIKEYTAGTRAIGEAIGISGVAVFKRIQSGSIKAIRIGNQYIVPATEIRRVRRIRSRR